MIFLKCSLIKTHVITEEELFPSTSLDALLAVVETDLVSLVLISVCVTCVLCVVVGIMIVGLVKHIVSSTDGFVVVLPSTIFITF